LADFSLFFSNFWDFLASQSESQMDFFSAPPEAEAVFGKRGCDLPHGKAVEFFISASPKIMIQLLVKQHF
jgi:hypothetical protein